MEPKKTKAQNEELLEPCGSHCGSRVRRREQRLLQSEAEDDCPSATTLDASEIHDSLGSVLPVEFGPPGRAALQGQTEPLGEGDRVDGGRT